MASWIPTGMQLVRATLGSMILLLDLVFLLFTIQRSLYFFGKGGKRRPEDGRVRLLSRSGNEIDLYLFEKTSQTDIIYFPGNFIIAEDHVKFCRYLSNIFGCSTISMIYRGVAGNPRTPSERGITEDLAAVSEWLSRRRTRKVVLGFSIGAAVAIRLGGMCSLDALILVNPFVSLRAVVGKVFIGRLLSHLVVDEWDNTKRIKDIDVPIHFVVSSDDEIVPSFHADELIKRARRPRKISLSNADHNEPMRNFMTHIYPVVSSVLASTCGQGW